MPARRFRVLVIGRGLIGSAAARHLAGRADGVALIGPDEPTSRHDHRDVFGSHYDEGRIYRVLDPDPIWARLALRSIERYDEIEAESGVVFHDEVGLLVVSPEQTARAEAYHRTAAQLGVESDLLAGDELARRFPYLEFGRGRVGAHQRRLAGHVSPRRLVEAQTIAAERRGATVVRGVVHRLEVDGGGGVATSASGLQLAAEQVLIATGAFANVHAVLPRPLELPVGGRTIVLAEVDAATQAQLRDMPSLIVSGCAPVPDVYVLPPIRYPNGKTYVKLGTGAFKHPLTTPADILAWFKHDGAEEDRSGLYATLAAMVPALKGAPFHSDTCAIDTTPSGYPYVDLIEDGRVAIAIGGNGSAAKSSDEIGRLGANLLLDGDWTDQELPRDAFRVQFAAERSARTAGHPGGADAASRTSAGRT